MEDGGEGEGGARLVVYSNKNEREGRKRRKETAAQR